MPKKLDTDGGYPEGFISPTTQGSRVKNPGGWPAPANVPMHGMRQTVFPPTINKGKSGGRKSRSDR